MASSVQCTMLPRLPSTKTLIGRLPRDAGAEAADAELARELEGAQHAGDPDPYRKPAEDFDDTEDVDAGDFDEDEDDDE